MDTSSASTSKSTSSASKPAQHLLFPHLLPLPCLLCIVFSILPYKTKKGLILSGARCATCSPFTTSPLSDPASRGGSCFPRAKTGERKTLQPTQTPATCNYALDTHGKCSSLKPEK